MVYNRPASSEASVPECACACIVLVHEMDSFGVLKSQMIQRKCFNRADILHTLAEFKKNINGTYIIWGLGWCSG